jgi:hypothetical protein
VRQLFRDRPSRELDCSGRRGRRACCRVRCCHRRRFDLLFNEMRRLPGGRRSDRAVPHVAARFDGGVADELLTNAIHCLGHPPVNFPPSALTATENEIVDAAGLLASPTLVALGTDTHRATSEASA